MGFGEGFDIVWYFLIYSFVFFNKFYFSWYYEIRKVIVFLDFKILVVFFFLVYCFRICVFNNNFVCFVYWSDYRVCNFVVYKNIGLIFVLYLGF